MPNQKKLNSKIISPISENLIVETVPNYRDTSDNWIKLPDGLRVQYKLLVVSHEQGFSLIEINLDKDGVITKTLTIQILEKTSQPEARHSRCVSNLRQLFGVDVESQSGIKQIQAIVARSLASL